MNLDTTTWFVIAVTSFILLADLFFVLRGGVKETISDHMAYWGTKRYNIVVWLWLFLTYHFWGYMWTMWLVKTHILVGPH